MAVGATADDAGVVHRSAGKVGKDACRMAGLACRTGGQVIHRLGYRGHSGKNLSVVAVGTAANDAGVAHRRPGKCGELACRMAALACRAGRQMICGFSYRRHAEKALAAVTTGAAAEYARMVHHTRNKSRDVMAYSTRLRRRQMVRWQHCSRRRLEGRCGGMAVLARGAGRQMVRRLGYRCHTVEVLIAVAACTATDDARMTEYHLLPACSFVAVIACHGSRNVSDRFA